MRPRLYRPLFLALALAALSGCPKPRVAAATQPSPPFNAAASDAKAVALVDAMLVKLGGADKWEKLKQIEWEETISIDGQPSAIFNQAWDRWNGRHRFETIDMNTYREAKAEDKPSLIKSTVAMYELFDRSKGVVYVDDNPVTRADRDHAIGNAYTRWLIDAYFLTLPYRLKDPGVTLKLEGEHPQDEFCPEVCDIVTVTFDPGVGKDTYHVNFLRSTGLPHMIEIEQAGKQGRIAYYLQDWAEAGGLKFPGKFKNVAANEEMIFDSIKVGEPDDELYIPRVQ